MSSSPPVYAVSVRSLYRTLLREAGRFFDKHTSAHLRSEIHRQFRREKTLAQARECLDALRCANANDMRSCHELMQKAWGRQGQVRDLLLLPIREHGGLPLQKLIETQFLPQHREFQPVANVEYSSDKLQAERRKHRLKLLGDLLPPVPYAWRAQLEELASRGCPDAGSVHPRVRQLRKEVYRKLLDETPVFMAVPGGAEDSGEREEVPDGGGVAASPAEESEPVPEITVKPNFMINFSRESNAFPPHVAPFIPGRPRGKPLPPGNAVLQEALAMGLQLAVGRSSLSVAALAMKGKPQIRPVHVWGFDPEGEYEDDVGSRRGKKKARARRKRVRRGRFKQAKGLAFAERALL